MHALLPPQPPPPPTPPRQVYLQITASPRPSLLSAFTAISQINQIDQDQAKHFPQDKRLANCTSTQVYFGSVVQRISDSLSLSHLYTHTRTHTHRHART